MTFEKGAAIVSIVTGVVGMAAAVIGTVDQIKNGDKRAILMGQAAGEQLANRAEAGGWYVVCGRRIDKATGKFLD